MNSLLLQVAHEDCTSSLFKKMLLWILKSVNFNLSIKLYVTHDYPLLTWDLFILKEGI